jgi:hypothetical protein
MILTILFIAFVTGGVIQLPDGSYQVPDNWKGCFVNPDDLSDTTFGCGGPVGGPDDYKNRSNASTIIINVQNKTTTFDVNGSGVFERGR